MRSEEVVVGQSENRGGRVPAGAGIVCLTWMQINLTSSSQYEGSIPLLWTVARAWSADLVMCSMKEKMLASEG